MEITERDKNGVVIFDIKGEIRRCDVSGITLHQLVKEKLEHGSRSMLLNFADVEFIDSFGVGEVLASYISTHNLGGHLKISRMSKKLHIVFQVTMLTKVLEIFEDEETALQSFS